MSDRSMSSANSAERSFRQRLLDAAAAAAKVVLPVFGPVDSLGTFDGANGTEALSAHALSARSRPTCQALLRDSPGNR